MDLKNQGSFANVNQFACGIFGAFEEPYLYQGSSFGGHTFFYKQPIFDPRPENCLSFSKKLPQKII